MPGPPAKPTAIKIVTGNPGKHSIRDDEPQPKALLPPAPDHLSPEGKSAWTRIGKMLLRIGVMTESDAPAFERLCELYSSIVEAEMDIRKNGRYQTVLMQTGEPLERARPVTKELADMDRRFLALLVQYGMTPAARTKIRVEAKGKDDPADKYFG